MGSNLNNVASPSLDDPPTKPSLFSRLAAPLRSRTRNLADFHVRLKEPHRQYAVGDRVQGSVVLSVVKPIRVTHLTVALHGYVRAYKSASNAAQLAPVNPAIISHGGKDVRYHGNGHASLFHDEMVLCGDGRLHASRWEFEFDLQFPDLELPSSIDFERGTIAYLVTATLTRPTSIAPTSSCEAKVALVERVDVGLVVPPRERKVFLQTMRRRSKKQKPVASAVVPMTKRQPPLTELTEPMSDRDSARATESSNDSAINTGNPTSANLDVDSLPRSPVPVDMQSEISGESVVSNNSVSYSLRGAGASGESATGSKHSGHEREITATVELLKGGCLPGDLIPVRIRVEHNRYMKSLHGIIVTLYRQGRVDYAPPISSFTGISKEDARKLERDEYYPRSKTGLGGLSLSSAGSCSVFRKDLSQAVAPLIVDPDTLTATITTAVRVPEDAFPSIRNVPGGLITFRYHVEVIVDLGGKLAGPSTGSSQSQQPTRMASATAVRDTYGIDLNLLANWNGAIVDTDHIRREKGVISVSFEIVVGTTDSSRSRGKSVVRPTLTLQAPSQEGPYNNEEAYDYDWQNDNNGDDGNIEYPEDMNPADFPHSEPGYFPQLNIPQTPHYNFQAHETQAPVYVPPPDIPDASSLTDKERARQAEQRLLPSQPPQQYLETEAGPSQPSAPSEIPSTTGLGSFAFALEAQPTANDDVREGPSAPTWSDLGPRPPNHQTDDKQELERQRLMAEASAPPNIPEDYDGGGPSAPTFNEPRSCPSCSYEPSAPTLDEENGYETEDRYHNILESSTPAGSSEPLPRYER
ncbi:hypothetical protein F5Y19DRAFT_419892 [Xylariaceae sp. FL1651]|nr:hypothetical protein F5Y19DRAFT_419892 [Xylariaceae sp. FL1651]